jgi:hypothetical protein
MSPDPIRICLLGKYAHRQPLAYATVRDLVADHLMLVDSPQEADILLVAHSKDLRSEAAVLGQFPDKKIVLLSEEPFWDTIWADDPFARQQRFVSEQGTFDFTFLNHYTSDIFAFEHIPYFLLTDYRFAPRYARRFARNARKSLRDWQTHFAKARIQAAFVAEKRMNEKFAVRFESQDTYGLCRFRSQVTEMPHNGVVLRAGKGWRKGMLRQELTDWHLDKLLMLDGQCRFVSALENTHQPAYLSEKLFDAFAVGGVALFYASKAHRLQGLLPAEAWLNVFGMTPQQAGAAMARFRFDQTFFRAYQQAQEQLAGLFCGPHMLARERDRLQGVLLEEFYQIQTKANTYR